LKLFKAPYKFLLKAIHANDANEDRAYLALTILTGIIAALVAVLLHKVTHYLVVEFRTNEAFDLRAIGFGLVAILISGYITTRKFPSTSGSGIPGVRVALAVFHGKITILNTIAKFVTSALSLSTGMSVGREGPTVSITAGIGSYLGQFFHLSKKRVKALVAVGSAGGIAAAFNTPIAAVVFTLEEIVGNLNAKILGAIIIASVTASVTAQILMGNSPALTMLNYKLGNYYELFFYLIIGLVASVAGPLWVKSVLKLRSINSKIFKGHKLSVILVSFFIIVAISYVRPEALGSGHDTIEEALLNLILDWKVLISLFVFKFIATTVSYGSGISGGLFMPTLLMGAILGSIVGSLCNLFFPEFGVNIGAYALVGMGAFFVSVIRAPFTSIIMVFEMTQDYHIILPLMIANITSYVISGRFHNGSIYESISEQDGIHLPTKDDNDVLETLTVDEAMVVEPKTLSASLTVEEALKVVKDLPFSGFPLLEKGQLVGMISLSEIGSYYAKGEKDKTLSEIAEKKIITIYPDQSLLVAFHKLNRFHVSRLPVVSRLNDKNIVGILTAENIVAQFGYHIQQDETDKHEELKEIERQVLEKSLETQAIDHQENNEDKENK
tara:strand:+ start:124061 stop:125893 length:1833 start_codon:yes stop_codon:yes gene_type:complete